MEDETMLKNYREREAELQEIVDLQRAILNRAESEDRELTASEQKRYDELDREYMDIQVRGIKPIPDGQYIPPSDEVRILKPSESFREAIGAQNRKGLSLGRLVRGAVTGD